MNSDRLLRMAVTVVALWAGLTAQAQLLDPEAQAISFQAKLTDVSGGPHELHITLYDADTGGSQVGDPIVIAATVQNGVVSEQIPIGDSSVFDEGLRLWAEVSVDADPPLSPRIPLIAVPYAFRVDRVGSVELDDDLVLGSGAASGSLQLYDDEGSVAITLLGAPGPDAPTVDAAGRVQMTEFKLTTAPQPGYVLTSDAEGLGTWQPPASGGFWTANGNDIYNNNPGNVGIGTSSPLHALHVSANGGQTIYGVNTAQSGESIGVYGVSESPGGAGVCGYAQAASGTTFGVFGAADSPDGYAGCFYGRGYFSGNVGIGTTTPDYPLHVNTDQSAAVFGCNSATTGACDGVVGWTESGGGWGIWGLASATSGENCGAVGLTDSSEGYGVYGFASAFSGTNCGVFGGTNSPNGYAGCFVGGRNYFEGNVGIGTESPSRQLDVVGATQPLARILSTDPFFGSVLELAHTAVDPTLLGAIDFVAGDDIWAPSGRIGYRGADDALTFSVNFAERMRISSNGYVGIGTDAPMEQLHVTSASGTAIQGHASTSVGVYGRTDGGFPSAGVKGEATSATGTVFGVFGEVDSADVAAAVRADNLSTGAYGYGVWAEHNGDGFGVYGKTETAGVGVYGVAGALTGFGGYLPGTGVAGNGPVCGVFGTVTFPAGGSTYGVYGEAAGGDPSDYAGFFNGRVHVAGTLSKSGGSFKIDHPLDPENKYLSHSFVESPDMMNVYNGNVTTDAAGLAAVELPDYFEALNRDYRYQLTVIGQFAQAIIDEKISKNRFVIRTDRPFVEVSWQVTGIRRDPWAEQNRIRVEEDKAPGHCGKYLHPELYGQPEEMGIHHVSGADDEFRPVSSDSGHDGTEPGRIAR